VNTPNNGHRNGKNRPDKGPTRGPARIPDLGSRRAEAPAIDLHGLEVAELLDAIELPADDPRAMHAKAQLIEHRELMHRVAGMRRDREALTTLAPTAPRGLLASAMERASAEAEREALLSLEASDSTVEALPVSRVLPARRRIAGRLRISPTSGWIAAAAALLLAVSLLAVEGARRLHALLNAPPRLAETPTRPTDTPPTIIAAGPADEPAAGDNAGTLAPTERTLAAVPDLDAGAAMLAEGRLVVRVSAPADTPWPAPRADALWAIEPSAPQTVLAALPPAALRSTPATPGAPVLAAEDEEARDPVVPVDHFLRPLAEPTVALARVRPERTALTALVAQLERTGFTVELLACDTPIPAPVDLSPEAVGWWGTPASSWPVRKAAPIIVVTDE
jgi:hypothetical protein